MEKFLLSLAARYYNEDLVKYALAFAKQKKATLIVLFVLDEELTNGIIDQLIDVGFIGDKPSEELRGAVLNEYEEQAKKQLNSIKTIAEKEGVKISTSVVNGDFVDTTLARAIDNAVDLIILNRERKGAVSKLFKGSPVDKLIKNAPCEVKVFES